jgi:SAM-dependent methyltransferase
MADGKRMESATRSQRELPRAHISHISHELLRFLDQLAVVSPALRVSTTPASGGGRSETPFNSQLPAMGGRWEVDCSRLLMRGEYLRGQLQRWMPRLPKPLPEPSVPVREIAPGSAPTLPPVGRMPLSRVQHLEDFANPDLAAWIKFAFPSHMRHPGFPVGREYRKHWEVAMALRTLAAAGTIPGRAEILGIAAGNEPTTFILTNYARRVFATDLYLAPGWDESASASMLTHPGMNFSGPWHPRRLIVQHMNALDLWYEDSTFDATFSSGSLEHFGSYAAVETAMREAWRVLKPGGVCTLSTEFRLLGPDPGMPSALMFSEEELCRHVLGSADWKPIGEMDFTPPPVASLSPVPYSQATVEVRRHQRRHSLMAFDEMEWSRWPHIALMHEGRTWTSCHLALRKPA